MAHRSTAQLNGPSAAAAPLQGDAFPSATLALIGELHSRFDGRRRALLQARLDRQARFDAGTERLDFRTDTAALREGDWQVATIPTSLRRRRVEITGPVEPKMIINALNSGADVFMADFEDSTTPTWANLVTGQLALRDAARATLTFSDPRSGKHYAMNEHTAVLMARPRGLHLDERHVTVDGQVTSGLMVDAAGYLAHNAAVQLASKHTPALYIPKLERMEEAALVDEILCAIEDGVGVARHSTKVTVLIETLPAAFEMDEILHALRHRIVGLNCGRWDYIFSAIKRQQKNPAFVTPDRSAMTMDKGFLAAYSQLLIKTCHRRHALAMGGMAAFIPVKGDAHKNDAAFAKVRADKEREANNGHDGTWVAHPGLVELAMSVFQGVLGEHDNQLHVKRDDVVASRDALVAPVAGQRTEAGLRHNLRVGVTYLASWLDGNGCVPIDHLMEDAATAEIARAQVWQWLHHGADVGGAPLTAARLRTTLDEETQALDGLRVRDARELFLEMSLAPTLAEFLTIPAYDLLET